MKSELVRSVFADREDAGVFDHEPARTIGDPGEAFSLIPLGDVEGARVERGHRRAPANVGDTQDARLDEASDPLERGAGVLSECKLAGDDRHRFAAPAGARTARAPSRS